MAESMARGIFSRDVLLGSAGIEAWEGEGASTEALVVMEERGFSLKEHRAKRLTRGQMVRADFVIPMTEHQERLLKMSYPEFGGKIRRLGAWGSIASDVTDPWGGPVERYRECADQITRLLDDVRRVLKADELRSPE